MAIDYHVILQDHVFKGHVTLSEGANLSYHSVKFGGHRHSGSEDIMSLVCHVILT